MRRIKHLLAVLLLATMFSTTGHAQTQTGTVEGRVLDDQGAVLPGATLTLTGPRGAQTTVTDSVGVYRFVGVAPGTYALKSELPGFLPQQVESVVVSLAKTALVEFTLKVGGLTENIEVRAVASNVDVKSSSTETNCQQRLLERCRSTRRRPRDC